MENKQHSQLPNNMELDNLAPKDQLVYVCLRSYMNHETMEAYPSINTIANKIGCSAPTVSSSIKRLENKEYIKIKKDGRKNVYIFNKLTKFEPFSPEFLNNNNISFETKAFVAASQQHMFKDMEGYGLISMSNRDLAKTLNISEKSVRRYNQELEQKELMTVLTNVSRDLETGCKTETKLYRLRDLGQAIIWKLKEHDDRITTNESAIQNMQEDLDKYKKLVNKLVTELAEVKNTKPETFLVD